ADAPAGNAISLPPALPGTNQEIKSAGDFRTKTAQGVAVQATSSEAAFTVDFTMGVGAFVGLAGSVAVTVIHSNTRAFIGDAVIHDPTGVHPNAPQPDTLGAPEF